MPPRSSWILAPARAPHDQLKGTVGRRARAYYLARVQRRGAAAGADKGAAISRHQEPVRGSTSERCHDLKQKYVLFDRKYARSRGVRSEQRVLSDVVVLDGAVASSLVFSSISSSDHVIRAPPPTHSHDGVFTAPNATSSTVHRRGPRRRW